MSEDEVEDWVADKLGEITDEHVIALQLGGWKIVAQKKDQHLWPFDSVYGGCDCPKWYEDMTETPAK